MSVVLVTGGAGFIGCHLSRALLDAGYTVRVLDTLERPGHTSDEPTRLDRRASFLRGDVRSTPDLITALRDVEIVFHLAATGGYTDRIGAYIDANSLGTARLLEAIRDGRGRVAKMVVASSVAVYGEGAGRCARHGVVHPGARPLGRLDHGLFEPICPECDAEVVSIATPESLSVAPERPYSITKFDQERLVLSIAPELGIDAAALRYFVTYGPGQSLTNPYTGVISIFANLLRRGQTPIVFEDGRQTRDFVFVSDLIAAHMRLLEQPRLDGRVFNVGVGRPVSLLEVANAVAAALHLDVEATCPGSYRLGDVRHIFADTGRLRALGWEPRVTLADGIAEFVTWLREQGASDASFAAAVSSLRDHGLIRPASSHA